MLFDTDIPSVFKICTCFKNVSNEPHDKNPIKDHKGLIINI